MMHRRGKTAVEPAARLGVRRATPLLRVGAVYFFFGSRYAPIRAEWVRIGRNRRNTPYRSRTADPGRNSKKKKVQNAPFGRNNKTLNYLTRFILQSSGLSHSLCSTAPPVPLGSLLSVSPLSQTHSVTQSHSPTHYSRTRYQTHLTSPTHSQLNSSLKLTSRTHSQLRMDDLFSISVHYGGYFTENPKTYVGGEVDVVDNCNPDKWSKIEIERICRDFGYASVSRLWYTMPGMDQERANFHLVVDDQDAMYMTELVKGHEEIHVYVEHPIDNPILVDEGEDVSEGVQPLVVEQGPMGYYSDDSDDDDHDAGEFYSFYDSDDMYANDQTFNKEDEPIEVDANDQTFNVDVATSQAGSRRVGKEPIIEHPPQVFIISDGSDSGCAGSGLDDEVELNHGVRDFVEDISDSWDDKDNDDDVVESSQMGASVMNSDYESEELHNLVESSSDDELGHDSDDDTMPNVHIASSSTNMTDYQTQRDHDNAPSDFAGKDSHFFKNILDDTLCDQKLMIPKMFIRKYGENLSSPTFLKLPNGAKWKVELTYHNGEVWLQKGWKKFAECCSLKRGHLLVFKFENNSHFHTVIFDESGTEIDYPANRPNSNEQGKVDEECESESSDQILSDSPQHPKTRRSHKRKWEALTGNDKAEALKKASGFKSKNPYFKVVMQPSFVKGWYMCVPVPFASQMYIQNGQEVMLKVGDQSWEVWFSIPKYRQRGSFSRGWSRFANENNLRVGDVCVFELIKSDDVVLKVSIFRV